LKGNAGIPDGKHVCGNAFVKASKNGTRIHNQANLTKIRAEIPDSCGAMAADFMVELKRRHRVNFCESVGRSLIDR
jgi:hypothetical protein